MIPYREPTRQELTVLRRTFNHWGIFDYVLDKEVLLKEEQFRGYKVREVYLSTRENFVILSKRMSLSHTGMLIGHLRRRSFLPFMAGADLIAREGVNFPFAVVNQTAEALVLYGRDVMQSSIVNYGNLGRNNTILIILNENRIAIGVGMTIVPIEKNIYYDDKRIVIKTIADAGQYLRNENRKDSGVTFKIMELEMNERYRQSSARKRRRL